MKPESHKSLSRKVIDSNIKSVQPPFYTYICQHYVEGVGVVVLYLAKLKGFVSLFSRMEGGNCTFQIPSTELFRFSHRVPSFKMTGQERVGVPVGSYELLSPLIFVGMGFWEI